MSDGKGDIHTDDRDLFSQNFPTALECGTKASSRRKGKSQMNEANKREASYILGHSEAEIIRLQTQAKISDVVLNVAAIFEWCNTKPLSENIVHVCLAGETTLVGDVNQQHLGLTK